MDRAHRIHLDPLSILHLYDGWHLVIQESIDQSMLDEDILYLYLPQEEIILSIKPIDLYFDCAYLLHILQSLSTAIIYTMVLSGSDINYYGINSL